MEYEHLKQRIVEAGLLEQKLEYELLQLSTVILVYFLVFYSLVFESTLWAQSLIAILLALAFVQVLFIAHDAGHHQIVSSKKLNNFIGTFIGSFLCGISYTWWVDKHNKHHNAPNVKGKDPDIHIGMLAFDQSQAKEKVGIARYITRYQSYFFVPLTFLEGIHLRVKSLKYIAGSRNFLSLDFIFFVSHFFFYLWFVFECLPLPNAIIFIALHQTLFGFFISSVFAVNHKGMEILSGDHDLDYVSLQVLTARDIRPNWISNFWYGIWFAGLHYQIEHHLFPRMPRRNFSKAKVIVREFCREREIPYEETDMVSSYDNVFTHLHSVGCYLRAKKQ